jgi:flavin-dependent dehydrogenase
MPSLATAPRVVIAGAGPAGSAAASLLREAGAIVTVVERAIAGEVLPARRGSVVVGREAWDVLRRVGGGSLLGDARNVVSDSEQLMSLRSLDTTLGAEAARRGASMLHGTAVEGVRELADGAGVSVALRDARTGATSHLDADWFIDATGGKTALASDARFARQEAHGAYELLPQRRGFLAAQAPADPARGVGWTAADGAFVINDRVEGVLTAYRPVTTAGPGAARPSVEHGEQLLAAAGVDGASLLGVPWTFTAKQSLAPNAAGGRILLVGDSVGTVMPATQSGTMLALTDAERAARTILDAHQAPDAATAAGLVDQYSATTLAMHRAFIR